MSAEVVAAGCVLAAAVAASWPSGRARRRHRWLWNREPSGAGPTAVALWTRLRDLHRLGGRHRLPIYAIGVGLVGFLLAGPVAGAAGAAYGALAYRALSRRRAVRDAATRHTQALDVLGALAADLRAGLPVPVAMAALVPTPVPGLDAPTASPARWAEPPSAAEPSLARLHRLARAAVALAEHTGAPLADLLDRIAADARSARRAVTAASAQAAGARATAWLLAALPLGGVALGFGVGADPLAVLLHTPIGAACAAAAIGLQVIGLVWSERLTRIPEAV